MFEKRKIKKLNLQRREEEAKTLLLIEQKKQTLIETYTSNTDPDESSWNLLAEQKEYYTEMELQGIREQAKKLFYTNGLARGMLRIINNYVVGKSCFVTPVDLDEKVVGYWNNFSIQNKLDFKIKEILERILRDGEMFLRFFKPENTSNPHLIRFIDPKEIKDLTGKWSYGIETDPDDVETVISYHRSYSINGVQKTEIIPADEIIHFKINVDSNEKRGVSFFVGIAKYIVHYSNWLNDRIHLNKIRGMFALVGSPNKSSITSTKDLFEDATNSQKSSYDSDFKKKAPKSGSAIFTKGIDWDFKAPNLQAGDTQHDGRAILLMIAASTGGLPEYMVTGDASNSNYASTLVSEAPGIKLFESFQDILEKVIFEMFDKVIERGIKTQTLPEKTEQTKINPKTLQEVKEILPTLTTCKINFQILIHRDLLEVTKALSLQVETGVCSKKQMTEELGRDFEQTQLEIAKETKQDSL